MLPRCKCGGDRFYMRTVTELQRWRRVDVELGGVCSRCDRRVTRIVKNKRRSDFHFV